MAEETTAVEVAAAAPAVEAPAQAANPVEDARSEAMKIVMGDVMQAAAAPADDGKKRRRSIPAGIAHITASFNNTQCCITDARGNVIAWSSAGKAGFKGSRKSTAFAGTLVAQECAKSAIGQGMHEVEVRVQGAGAGRESAIRAIANSGMAISQIKDITPMPHNGCRQRKRRRV
jgi:small subunit ribosomal protein S11